MPSTYFYHLKFELYPTSQTDSFTSKSHRSEHLHDTSRFIPPPGYDIFQFHLPAHRIETSASYGSFSPRHHERSSLTKSIDSNPEHLTSYGDSLLLPERSSNLRLDGVPLHKGAVISPPSQQKATQDWRYESVRIGSINMDMKHKSTTGGGLHTKAVYVPSDLKETDVGYGVVHLYRDLEDSTITEEGGALARLSIDKTTRSKDGDNKAFSPDECTTLCILAVPSWMMPSDLLGFVGDQAVSEDVSHFRLIRTGRANKYMVLMKFRSARKAKEWQKAYNGRLFSAAEPENCHVVYIKSVEFVSPDNDTGNANFPHNTNDPFTTVSTVGKSLYGKPQAPPPPNLLELPTCPVCLERMDETTGLLTILCQHVFHCACLEKWRGSGCPVCRYTHSPSFTFPYPRPASLDDISADDPEPLCSVCTSTSNLWICLICGNIGCGRYDSAHAYAHYEETSHCYAMDISTQRVWDYAGDGYVHRLIQSKPTTTTNPSNNTPNPTSHLIDLPSRHENEAFRAEAADNVPREKMENMATEYTYLLTSQLEGQRRYFEEQVKRAADKAAQAASRADEAASRLKVAVDEMDGLRVRVSEAEERVARAQKGWEKADAAKGRLEGTARMVTGQLREERVMNEGLLERVKVLEAEREELKGKVGELEEMNHDLTQFISGQEKVAQLREAGEEVVEMRLEPGKKGKGRKRK